ncbi:MAG: DUF2202 domain-containing protein [Magnetospirillum sp.]
MSRYDAPTITAIHEALDDEYKARATYAAIIERHGAVRPFVNIIASEDRHARALERLLSNHGLPIPADNWAGKVTAPETLQQAFSLGVQAEIENRDMYDRLERMTREPDVLRVFGNLRTASQENHLPAFQRHLDRSSGNTGHAQPMPGRSYAATQASSDAMHHHGGGKGRGCGSGGGMGPGHGRHRGGPHQGMGR